MDRLPRVTLLDSTLRDGAQGEGVSFSVTDKISVVRALDALGVDIIEAGNPGSNPKDAEFFREARGLRLARSTLAAFGSTRRRDTRPESDAQLASLLAADTGIVVLFGKSWTFHVRAVLGVSLEENLAMIGDSVAFLRSAGRRVIFDAEHFFDGFAADPDYALACLRSARDAGAECMVLCDTNGGSLPSRVAEFTRRAAVVGAPLGIHAHNDSGLGVANSLTAVEAGAVHVQGTLAGFGERCGNANLSTVAADLQLKMGRDCLGPGALAGLAGAVRRVTEIANLTPDEGMPYVGRRAFAHKAGMHVDAVRKDPASFEHVPPGAVGNERRFLASEVGGRSVLMDRFRRILPDAAKDSPEVVRAAEALKKMEGLGYQYEGAEASLEILLRKAAGSYVPSFKLRRYRTTGEHPAEDPSACAHAMVQLEVEGRREISAAEGCGPVHALDLALRKALVGFYPSLAGMRLADYKVRVLPGTGATASVVRVLIDSSDSRDVWTTVGVSADILEASWIALVDSYEYKLSKDTQSETRRETGDEHADDDDAEDLGRACGA
ncbi:MAG TPA: citramalate synthase [Spirochaetia bacterium]|nr:citramalate synthase [Spirochaetia bacterium]HRZ87896.1 citramalate synthase [Spirochaetia bacterium]